MNEHELGFTAFLTEPTKRRVRTLLELGPKRRNGVRALLDYAVHLDMRYTHRLEGSASAARSVEEALRTSGAPGTCHLISADKTLNGLEMSLSAALDAVLASSYGTFISCIPGKLGVFEYENIKSAYLLAK